MRRRLGPGLYYAVLLANECGLRTLPKSRVPFFELVCEVRYWISGNDPDPDDSAVHALPPEQRIRFSEKFFFDKKTKARSFHRLKALGFDGNFQAPKFALPEENWVFVVKAERGSNGLRWSMGWCDSRPEAPAEALKAWRRAWGRRQSYNHQVEMMRKE